LIKLLTAIVLNGCAAVWMIWAYVTIPDVALYIADKSSYNDRMRAVSHGPAVWALGACALIFVFPLLLIELFPSLEEASARHAKAGPVIMIGEVLLMLAILWRTWL